MWFCAKVDGTTSIEAFYAVDKSGDRELLENAHFHIVACPVVWPRSTQHSTLRGAVNEYRPKGVDALRIGKVTAGLAKSNGSLPPAGWLIVTCGLTACTLGSAPGPTLGNEYGKPLRFICFSVSFIDQLLHVVPGSCITLRPRHHINKLVFYLAFVVQNYRHYCISIKSIIKPHRMHCRDAAY